MTNKKLTESCNFLGKLKTTVRCMKLDLFSIAQLFSLVADLAVFRNSLLKLVSCLIASQFNGEYDHVSEMREIIGVMRESVRNDAKACDSRKVLAIWGCLPDSQLAITLSYARKCRVICIRLHLVSQNLIKKWLSSSFFKIQRINSP